MTEWDTDFVGKSPRIAIDFMGEGPLVVFLHGLGGNRTNWHEQLPVFADRFNAVTWDARGYGDSDDYEGPFRFEDVAADLMKVFDHFGAEQGFLVGLSMGGRICLETYKRYPERIRAIVFADTSGGMQDKVPPDEQEKQTRMRREPLMKAGGPRQMAESVAPSLVSPKTPPDVVERLKDSLAAIHVESYLKALETVATYTDFPPFDTIAVPCLVIAGADDPLARPDMTRFMADEIPNAQYVLIPDCGHLSNLERPTEFNDAVRRFLMAQLSPARHR